jgi:hypothetical protein
LQLESLNLRLAPSSLVDDPLGQNDAAEFLLFREVMNAAPRIVNFQGVEVVGGLWRFTGDVLDEDPAGLTVTFGGEPSSLQGMTETTDANGHFEKTMLLKTDGSDNGLASAQTVDRGGLVSSVALYGINPG